MIYKAVEQGNHWLKPVTKQRTHIDCYYFFTNAKCSLRLSSKFFSQEDLPVKRFDVLIFLKIMRFGFKIPSQKLKTSKLSHFKQVYIGHPLPKNCTFGPSVYLCRYYSVGYKLQLSTLAKLCHPIFAI